MFIQQEIRRGSSETSAASGEYEIRPASKGSGARLVRRKTGETVVCDGRALDGVSFRAAMDIVALLERIDALRAEHHRRIVNSDDLVAILDLSRDAANGVDNRR
jgi:hypothetical protein